MLEESSLEKVNEFFLVNFIIGVLLDPIFFCIIEMEFDPTFFFIIEMELMLRPDCKEQ
jgi:hypothetical protein